ncbi:RadC family protein [Neptunitalea lumnitzerae]|uniref:DNA repair protein RadC n=1 Tax=Neptunitalea lumnitzerae TaxID=2965509 RepID=A0ABQ5MIE3_9FLAO|nr:DNA repair protein RadC [Neptunitalea sp. Y10]GLB48815.1 DNA repair protein RadC [Neptunitalea sp. Y10]
MKEKTETFSIKNWSLDDRPREKLLQKGKDILSDAELIAILIGSGSRNESAVDLSKRLLHSVDFSLNELGKLTVQELTKFKGIGEAKAITIIAAAELGRRRKSEEVREKVKITSSKLAYHVFQPIIGELPHEEFWVAYLNNSNKVIATTQLSKGGITGTLVDVRLVFKQALTCGATSIILAHNHPSGTLQPSEMDKKLTTKICTAGNSLDIKVLDHLIVTEKTYFSFADEGLL